MSGRLITAGLAAYAAYALAVGIGIPRWIDWPTWQVPADAADIAMLVGLAVYRLAR